MFLINYFISYIYHNFLTCYTNFLNGEKENKIYAIKEPKPKLQPTKILSII